MHMYVCMYYMYSVPLAAYFLECIHAKKGKKKRQAGKDDLPVLYVLYLPTVRYRIKLGAGNRGDRVRHGYALDVGNLAAGYMYWLYGGYAWW